MFHNSRSLGTRFKFRNQFQSLCSVFFYRCVCAIRNYYSFVRNVQNKYIFCGCFRTSAQKIKKTEPLFEQIRGPRSTTDSTAAQQCTLHGQVSEWHMRAHIGIIILFASTRRRQTPKNRRPI